jgi:hypothetical protein
MRHRRIDRVDYSANSSNSIFFAGQLRTLMIENLLQQQKTLLKVVEEVV